MLPDQDRDPSMVAPYLNKTAHPFSSVHVLPPSCVRSGTAPPRSMNMIAVVLINSFVNFPVSPVALLHADHVLPPSLLLARQLSIKAKRLLGDVGSTESPGERMGGGVIQGGAGGGGERERKGERERGE